MNLKYGIKILFFLCLLIIELFAHNYWLKGYSVHTRTFLYLGAGLLISIIPILKIYPARPIKSHWLMTPVSFILFGLLSWYVWEFGLDLLSTWQVTIKNADMLPVISKMNQRFIEGKEVYAIIPEIWGGMQPIYLPTMWMAYLPAFLFEFDLRWMSIGLIMFGIFATVILLPDFKKRTYLSFLPLIPAFLVFYTYANKDPMTLAFSEEGVVIGYYLILMFALYRGNPFFKGLAFSLCLLSRYSLLFWLMMYVVYWFFYKSKKEAILMSVYTGLICLLLMFVSQALFRLDLFIGLPKIYDEAISDPGLKWKYEPMINRGLGIAKYFTYENLTTLSTLFKITSIALPFALLGLYAKFKDKINKPLFAFCALKLCLVFFYGMIIMPFKYLFFTNTILSIALFAVMIEVDRKAVCKFISG
jgi:hypothetical protein